MSDIADLSTSLLLLTPGECEPEALLELYARGTFQMQQAKEILGRIKEAMILHIQATGKPLVCGDKTYIVSNGTLEHSCNDNATTFDKLCEHEGGHIAFTVAHYLISEPFKSGSVKKALGDDEFAKLFTSTRKPKLVEGKAVPQLVELDQRFIK